MLEPIFAAPSGQTLKDILVLQIVHPSHPLTRFKLLDAGEGAAASSISSGNLSRIVVAEFHPVTVRNLDLEMSMDSNQDIPKCNRLIIHRAMYREVVGVVIGWFEGYWPLRNSVAGDNHLCHSWMRGLLLQLMQRKRSS